MANAIGWRARNIALVPKLGLDTAIQDAQQIVEFLINGCQGPFNRSEYLPW